MDDAHALVRPRIEGSNTNRQPAVVHQPEPQAFWAFSGKDGLPGTCVIERKVHVWLRSVDDKRRLGALRENRERDERWLCRADHNIARLG